MSKIVEDAVKLLEDTWKPVTGAGLGGTVGTTNAAQPESFIFRLLDSGFFDMFSDWARGDTYAVIGICFTFISIRQTAEVIRLRKKDADSK